MTSRPKGLKHVFNEAGGYFCRSQWPRGLMRRSAAARLLRSWVRILPSPWMFVCCECYVLSGRGLCDEPITRPEKSYRCVWSRNLMNEETMAHIGPQRHRKTKKFCFIICCCLYVCVDSLFGCVGCVTESCTVWIIVGFLDVATTVIKDVPS